MIILKANRKIAPKMIDEMKRILREESGHTVTILPRELEVEAILKDIREIDNKELIPRIEKALGFKLYPATKRYLETEEPYQWSGRNCGKTTAYILKMVINKDTTIDWKDLIQGHYVDSYHGPCYQHYFLKEFMKIRNLLKKEGIEVIKIKGAKGEVHM